MKFDVLLFSFSTWLEMWTIVWFADRQAKITANIHHSNQRTFIIKEQLKKISNYKCGSCHRSSALSGAMVWLTLFPGRPTGPGGPLNIRYFFPSDPVTTSQCLGELLCIVLSWGVSGFFCPRRFVEPWPGVTDPEVMYVPEGNRSSSVRFRSRSCECTWFLFTRLVSVEESRSMMCSEGFEGETGWCFCGRRSSTMDLEVVDWAWFTVLL